MRYRTLGVSGGAVSTLSLGTMTFGSESDEAISHAQLDRLKSADGTPNDTANVYSGSNSESINLKPLPRSWRPSSSGPRAATTGVPSRPAPLVCHCPAPQ
jgi:predicted aldo/keto reductase-like oxidoreductase